MLVLLAACHNLGHAPVHDLHFAKAPNHDVGRLEVAVNDAARVRKGDAFAQLQEHLEQTRQRPLPQHVLVTGAQLGKDLVEAPALHQLHGEVQVALAVDADFVDGHNVGVFKLARNLGFFQEALNEVAPAYQFLAKHLQCHTAPEIGILNFEHLAHAAARNFTDHHVALAPLLRLPRQLTEGRCALGTAGNIHASPDLHLGAQLRDRHFRRINERTRLLDVRRVEADAARALLGLARTGRGGLAASGGLPGALLRLGFVLQRNHGEAAVTLGFLVHYFRRFLEGLLGNLVGGRLLSRRHGEAAIEVRLLLHHVGGLVLGRSCDLLRRRLALLGQGPRGRLLLGGRSRPLLPLGRRRSRGGRHGETALEVWLFFFDQRGAGGAFRGFTLGKGGNGLALLEHGVTTAIERRRQLHLQRRGRWRRRTCGNAGFFGDLLELGAGISPPREVACGGGFGRRGKFPNNGPGAGRIEIAGLDGHRVDGRWLPLLAAPQQLAPKAVRLGTGQQAALKRPVDELLIEIQLLHATREIVDNEIRRRNSMIAAA